MKIAVEPPRLLPVSDELKLIKEGLARNAGAQALRNRNATLLNFVDRFDEAIASIEATAVEQDDLETRLTLATAYFSRGKSTDVDSARKVLTRALTPTLSDADRSHVLSELARVHLRLGEAAMAQDLLKQALALNPSNAKAFGRLAMELIRQGRSEQALALTDELLTSGVKHARLLAVRTLALTVIVRTVEARELVRTSEFVYQKPIELPAAWTSLQRFNAALIDEISKNPDFRYGRFGTASRNTWRVDDPGMGGGPAVHALLAKIATAAENFRHSLERVNHPWLAACPTRAVLRSWCVMTEGEGFERWHLHPNGWMSGGYYVQVPDEVTRGNDEAGCLELGLPSDLIGRAAADDFGQTLVRPLPGLLTLFPSHAYHRTHPHKTAGRRMCLAFDICPSESRPPP